MEPPLHLLTLNVKTVSHQFTVTIPASASVAQGWMIKLKNINVKDVEKLLDSKAYAKEVDNAKH